VPNARHLFDRCTYTRNEDYRTVSKSGNGVIAKNGINLSVLKYENLNLVEPTIIGLRIMELRIRIVRMDEVKNGTMRQSKAMFYRDTFTLMYLLMYLFFINTFKIP
jgi:hypothetical protein